MEQQSGHTMHKRLEFQVAILGKIEFVRWNRDRNMIGHCRKIKNKNIAGGKEMLSFVNDYSEGAHEKILERLVETNRESLSGYGTDKYSDSAKEKIRQACNCPDADVYFLVGGTQTNQTVIDAVLNQYEGVVAAETGHVNVHEAGAIEFTGHKVLTIPQHDGKICAKELQEFIATFYEDANHEHMVFPGMTYISHPTELGTLYTKKELQDISEVCKEYHIPLYLDGARMGYALASDGTEVTLADIAKYCDAFYIGGTKVGALCGEAVVFPRNAPKHFLTIIKQHGALLAKGRLTALQFDTLFTDNLYTEISRNAIKTANMLRQAFEEKGYIFYQKNPTNQIFIVLENEKIKELKKQVAFDFWEKADDTHTVVRFATSWATREEDVKALIEIL